MSGPRAAAIDLAIRLAEYVDNRLLEASQAMRGTRNGVLAEDLGYSRKTIEADFDRLMGFIRQKQNDKKRKTVKKNKFP